jgi:hypothetical protein
MSKGWVEGELSWGRKEGEGGLGEEERGRIEGRGNIVLTMKRGIA